LFAKQDVMHIFVFDIPHVFFDTVTSSPGPFSQERRGEHSIYQLHGPSPSLLGEGDEGERMEKN
jgi:hypothetical protein